jgi:RNA polymerase sigma-70 factor, ECF subfamily
LNRKRFILERPEQEAAARAARESYGRLLALVAARSLDLQAAEDALADAFSAALTSWPRDGVPEKPEAWLFACARRRLIDGGRRARTARAGENVLAILSEEVESELRELPDERLKLLFVCTHPAIDSSIQTPLMLQVVLGLDVARIANAFLVSPAAMGQRLVRAKLKIRDAGIAFSVPEPRDLPARAAAVLAAIYAAYGAAWEDATSGEAKSRNLGEEALFLARLAASLLPQDAEAHGLLALILHCEARSSARRATDGSFVPLSQQDVALWNRSFIGEAERALVVAASCACLGRYQLEAAIQSVHAGRMLTGQTDWNAIAQLHEGLLVLAPTTGASVARAAAVLEALGTQAALTALDAIPEASVIAYQPYWAVRGEACLRAGEHALATEAFERALGLTADRAVRSYLLQRIGYSSRE